MTQPVPEPRYRDANDLLMSGGAPSFKFARIGDTITGTVLRMDMAVQRDPVTQLPKHYEKTGEEKMQLVITLQTDLRDPAVERDDGRRRIFVKPVRWSGRGTSSATEPARRVRSRPKTRSSTSVRMKGTDGFNPLNVERNLGRNESL